MCPLPATMQAPCDLTCRREEADTRWGGQLGGVPVKAHRGQAPCLPEAGLGETPEAPSGCSKGRT